MGLALLAGIAMFVGALTFGIVLFLLLRRLRF